MGRIRVLGATIATVVVAGCAATPNDPVASEPELVVATPSMQELRRLPPPERQLVVAVYDFPDLTGQHRPNERYADYSRAVSQGGAAILIKALQDAGDRRWFQVIERNNLDALLQERQIIRQTREQYLGPDGQPLPAIGPLLNAGILLTGGVVGYETNTLTGGFGARFLGIGGHTQYRRDMVTVELRSVSTQTGEVLTSVTTSKTIYSVGVQGSFFRYVSFERLLEIEGGYTSNEPPQLALRQAIEKAVHGTIVEGSLRNFWRFADERAARPLVDQYLREREGELLPTGNHLEAVRPEGTRRSAVDGRS